MRPAAGKLTRDVWPKPNADSDVGARLVVKERGRVLLRQFLQRCCSDLAGNSGERVAKRHSFVQRIDDRRADLDVGRGRSALLTAGTNPLDIVVQAERGDAS